MVNTSTNQQVLIFAIVILESSITHTIRKYEAIMIELARQTLIMATYIYIVVINVLVKLERTTTILMKT